jgi:hypothetical protein
MYWRRLFSVAVVMMGAGPIFVPVAATSRIQRSEPTPCPLKMQANGPTWGFYYSPQVLAALTAREDAVVSPRLRRATKQGTPVVVMWNLAIGDMSAASRPFKLAVLESAGRDGSDPTGVQPLWLDQQAADLVQLDDRLTHEDIGAVAAFPREAFALGRWLYLYSGPHRNQDGSRKLYQRWVTIWSPAC